MTDQSRQQAVQVDRQGLVLGPGLVSLLATALLLALFYFARDLLLPVVLALLVSLSLAPLVHRLLVRGWPKPVAALVPLLLLTVLLSGGVALLGQSLLDWLQTSSHAVDRMLERIAPVQQQLQDVSASTEALDRKVSEAMPGNDNNALVVRQTTWRQQLVAHAGATVGTLGVALCLAFFLLSHGDRLFFNWWRQLDNRQLRRQVIRGVREVRTGVARYLGTVLAMNTLIGLAAGAVLALVGAPEPWVWGIIAGLLRFVPYLGVLLATALLATVSVVAVSDPLLWLLPPLGYWLTTVVVGMVVEPHVHGYRMQVNPVVIFLAIILWGWLWGLPGVLLAVPLLTVVYALCRHIDPLKPLARLMGE